MMGQKKTHAQYEEELFLKEIDYFPIEEYAGARTPIVHECLNGHFWKVTPDNILRKTAGCPICAGKGKSDTERYLQALKEREIEHIPLEPYVTAQHKILHQCPLGHTWKIHPNNILSGFGCPDCARKGVYNEVYFKKYPEKAKEPGILYCLVLVNKKTSERECIKIGITKGKSFQNVTKRAYAFTGYEHRVQKLVKGTLEEVYLLEQKLHEKWKHKKYVPKHWFSGHTELFELDDEIIRSIPKSV